MWSLFVLFIEIVCKIYVDTPQGVLPLKKAEREAAAQRRPDKTRLKKRVFSAKRQVVWVKTP